MCHCGPTQASLRVDQADRGTPVPVERRLAELRVLGGYRGAPLRVSEVMR